MIFAVENVSYGTFADPSFEMVMDAIYTAHLDWEENLLVGAQKLLALYQAHF
jgi:hypothetical protein